MLYTVHINNTLIQNVFIFAVETIHTELMTLESRKPKVDIYSLLVDKLSLLQVLDISGLRITNRGVDLIAVTLSYIASLKLLDISYTKIDTNKCAKIFRALKHVSSLQCLKMSNNSFSDEVADYMTAIIGNCKIEELDISNNELSSVGVIKIINSLSKSSAIKGLDISNNCVSIDNAEILSVTIANCFTLQELNLSQNSLMFFGVVKIAQALTDHPNLKHLNIENNIISSFSESEFLVDIILSTNQSLKYLNVCGRNIRPRFVEDYLCPPPNCKGGAGKFFFQNLYLSQYMLLKSASSQNKHRCVEVSGCPIASENVASYQIDHNGASIYDAEHNFALIVPPGVISQGESITMYATTSRFGLYKLPDGYYPVSSFYWISAGHHYFNSQVYLILNHFAGARNLENMCVAEACDNCTGEESLVMKETSGQVYFDNDLNYCIIATNHFCSYCVLSNRKGGDKQFIALYYTYDDDTTGSCKVHIAEVCFCPFNANCIKVREIFVVLCCQWTYHCPNKALWKAASICMKFLNHTKLYIVNTVTDLGFLKGGFCSAEECKLMSAKS